MVLGDGRGTFAACSCEVQQPGPVQMQQSVERVYLDGAAYCGPSAGLMSREP